MADKKPLPSDAVEGSVVNSNGELKDAGRDADILDTLEICVVHDAFAHTGAYVVHTPSGASKPAVKLTEVSSTPLGARELTHYQIGDSVICLFLPAYTYGLILGSAPPTQFDARFVLPDSMVMRSRAGFFEDQMHFTPYENTDNNLANWSGGRPVDSLQGDWGYINEFGAATFIGKLMASIRASDVAKFEAFWGDDLVRIFGYNLHLLTAARERLAFDDEGEYDEVDRWTPFMWESLGAYEAGEEVFEDNEGESGGLEKGQEKSRFEPKEEGQTMVFRGQTLRGYLGDGTRESITLLPPDASGLSKRDPESDDVPKYRGILEVSHTLDGTFAVRSSKQIILEKSLVLPIPFQRRDPDDPSGDKASGDDANYKAAGYYGGGDTQEKKPFEWPEDDYAANRATLLWEQEEYLFNKFALQVIDAHEEDWKAPEVEDLKIDDSKQNEIDSELFSTPLLFDAAKKLPKYGEVQIDQREGYEVRYYQSRSCFHMLDDGSVIIEDGYGGQIIMGGGHIRLTCPGDIFAQPGRNFIAMAPRDFIGRAGWCAEMTAAEGDLRLKSENNMHLLAGDGENGSILIESRSEGRPNKSAWTGKYGEDIESSGVIIKAEESAINMWTKNLFGGVPKEDVGVVEFSSGDGKTVLDGKEVGIEATKKFGVLVGNDRSQTADPGQFVLEERDAWLRANLDMIGDLGVWQGSKGNGRVECDGRVWTQAGMKAVSSITCGGTMSATSMASSSFHNSLNGGDPPQFDSRAGEVMGETDEAQFDLYFVFERATQDDSSVGAANREVWDAIGFSFRKSVEHYKIADDFKITEARWQQMYRVNGNKEKWEEPVVEAPDGTETRPYPGNDAWEQTDHYSYFDPSSSENVDYKKGRAKKREDQTEQSPEMKDGKLKDDYIINVQYTS